MTSPTSPASSRVALVTGAAQGIGHAAAARFLAEGWSVVMLDWKKDVLVAAAEAFRAPDRVLALHKDVSQPSDVAAALDEVRTRFGRLDALVNNAGIAHFGPLMETPLEAWNEVMAVNVTGPFMMTKAAVPLMRETGGAIVNITSISSLRASTLRVAYGTSKAALGHLTKQMAVELASYGIRVNAVAPGPVDTAMAKKVHSPEIRADYHDAIPLNRYGLPEELADAIVYLCSPGASYITGQTLAVDGGFDATGIGLPTLRRDQRNG
ncbi:SDR family oxidoreductase [Phreatobacter sp.]|uniref:SDR family NAD(P)-dependent oxidoreductase n=1 Tax=Phreatobacter sp. TaxID=1966341 RepID=UPI0022CC1B7A|nr:SDR family oxidoreductase [Phreatobacter sp.]MCZ8313787.1 SDR family oxidoreductase [Phreatobacter sp.]